MTKSNLGRIIGQVSAVVGGTSSLAFASYVWKSYPDDRSVSWVMLGIFVISGIGLYVAVKQRPVVLIAAFIMTFFPVGLWLALHPHWARIAGLAPLGYLLAAWLIKSGNKQKPDPP